MHPIIPVKMEKELNQQAKNSSIIWRPSSQSELTPMIFETGLTHLGSEASK